MNIFIGILFNQSYNHSTSTKRMHTYSYLHTYNLGHLHIMYFMTYKIYRLTFLTIFRCSLKFSINIETVKCTVFEKLTLKQFDLYINPFCFCSQMPAINPIDPFRSFSYSFPSHLINCITIYWKRNNLSRLLKLTPLLLHRFAHYGKCYLLDL